MVVSVLAAEQSVRAAERLDRFSIFAEKRRPRTESRADASSSPLVFTVANRIPATKQASPIPVTKQANLIAKQVAPTAKQASHIAKRDAPNVVTNRKLKPEISNETLDYVRIQVVRMYVQRKLLGFWFRAALSTLLLSVLGVVCYCFLKTLPAIELSRFF